MTEVRIVTDEPHTKEFMETLAIGAMVALVAVGAASKWKAWIVRRTMKRYGIVEDKRR